MSLGDSWNYIGEGNAHIVIELLNTNYVLRLRKENGEQFGLDSMQKSVNFVNLVMIPLLFSGKINVNQIVEIPPEQLRELTNKLCNLRPEHRKCKSIINNYAIKSTNLTMVTLNTSKNYCIEIKPKEGYITASFKKISMCYYCLKQYLKCEQGEIDIVSKYCPLDLFSADKTRMRSALLNLIDNPQNNFKLFLNGNVIYSEKSMRTDFDEILRDMVLFNNSLELFLNFIIEILLGNQYSSNIVVNESNKLVMADHQMKHCFESNNMQSGSILHKLLQLQKLSENKDIYVNTENNDYDYVESILKNLELNAMDLSIEEEKEKFLSLCEPEHLAMISAVAKDCSIMISFTPDYDSNFPYIEIRGKKISYRLSVTDLEPKSTKTLLKRKDTETKLLNIYKKSLESK
ncbi:inositol-pentakisphosphate 2-kinase-like isoform X1 [Galleria mellonella]|uniref:Inositol-pentakisphosphate 2-kinase n=1 Tax=Galleria mellonella TaxID=7137 RepID=A0A6J1WSH6_GALME|nr:inositol-pentakisphosphate 2-kinase-like isoform X1 [Galleria mellonella]